MYQRRGIPGTNWSEFESDTPNDVLDRTTRGILNTEPEWLGSELIPSEITAVENHFGVSIEGEGALPEYPEEILVSENLGDRAGFNTIGGALSGEGGENGAQGADNGDTIVVESGTYDESIVVDTPGLTITGTTDPTSGTSTVTGQARETIEVRADDVTIEQLELRNPSGSPAGPTDFSGAVGVSVESGNTGVTIRDCLITDIGTANDDANPIGVYAQGATDDITVEDNRIETLEGTNEDEGAVQAVLINSQREIDGIDSGIENASVTGNVITNLLDTRSTNAVRFNGDVTGEIVGNDISDLNTEGTIPESDGSPGGFTQAISLAAGENSPTGPSEVTISGNDISQLETTTDDNFAAPVHVLIGSDADDSSISIDSNDFSGDSSDVGEVYLLDSTRSLELGTIQEDNSFDPDGLISSGGESPGTITRTLTLSKVTVKSRQATDIDVNISGAGTVFQALPPGETRETEDLSVAAPFGEVRITINPVNGGTGTTVVKEVEPDGELNIVY
jgi:hypothetical protein